jgi:hypothetical protein
MRPKQHHENAIGNSERHNCWHEPWLSFMCAVAPRRQYEPNHRKKVQIGDDPDQETGFFLNGDLASDFSRSFTTWLQVSAVMLGQKPS